jgi:hypothetical protein
MLDFIREARTVENGLHNIILEIPEETYMTFYKDINYEYAKDILLQYLKSRQDDAAARDIEIKHNKKHHTVNIYANLHYIGNEKPDQEPFTDNYIRHID